MHLEMNAWSCEMKCLCFVELQDNTAEQNCVLAVLSTNQLEGNELMFLRHNLIEVSKFETVQRFRLFTISFEIIIKNTLWTKSCDNRSKSVFWMEAYGFLLRSTLMNVINQKSYVNKIWEIIFEGKLCVKFWLEIPSKSDSWLNSCTIHEDQLRCKSLMEQR